MILTTHTMHEAESLCSTIGILIKGRFVIIGTSNELKMKYGKGYRITIKNFPQKKETVKNMLQDELKGIIQIEDQ